jgi:hypothetical protein
MTVTDGPRNEHGEPPSPPAAGTYEGQLAARAAKLLPGIGTEERLELLGVMDEGDMRTSLAPRTSAARWSRSWRASCSSRQSASRTRTAGAACSSGCTSRASREVAVNGDRFRRGSMWALASGVAAIAAIVSYSHVYDLGRAHGGSGVSARLLPLSVDMRVPTPQFSRNATVAPAAPCWP